MKTLNPYLTFDGTCEAAFNFYKDIFGGQIVFLARYKDIPPTDQPLPDFSKEKIMHIVLPITPEISLMGADALKEFPYTPTVSKDVTISINLHEENDAKRIFEGLAKGGKITIPMQKTFWANIYGLCIDKFGIQWMVSVENE